MLFSVINIWGNTIFNLYDRKVNINGAIGQSKWKVTSNREKQKTNLGKIGFFSKPISFL